MIRRARLRVLSDDGAILVFALIITTAIALVVGTVLTRGQGSLRATVALREVAGSSYAADAAADVAINNLRTGAGFAGNPTESAFNNSLDGAGCFGNNVGNGGTDRLTLDRIYPPVGSVGASSALVECTGEQGTGMTGSPVPINNSNKPGQAIITLKGPVTTTDPLKVHGGVYSNSTINGPVSLDAGDAWATGACPETTVAARATKHCNSGQTIADPNYTNDLGGTVPDLRAPPTSCTSGVAVFEPGYYDDVVALNAATALCPVAWFKPGTYYFDFHNDGCANVCPLGVFGSGTTSASNVWRILGTSVVGGTPTDANGNILSSPPASPVMPRACQSPITDVNAKGVQFVFGGNSQMYVDQDAHVELCGTYHANRPPIELYGLKSGSTPSATNANARTATAVPVSGSFTGATVANLEAANDGKAATWTTTSATAQSNTITVKGFGAGAPVPAGSILTSAKLHIRHQDADATNASTGSATLRVGGVTTASLSVPASASLTTTDFNIAGTDLKKLQKEVHDNGYTEASVDYTANAKRSNATATLDQVSVDLTYYVPVLRGEGGTCIDGTNGSCQLLSMKGGNNKILFYLQGTTYIPYADASILLGNFSAEVAKFGVIARQLEFSITNGNPSWTGPIFEIPDNSPGYGYENTTVDLTVHLCMGKPSGCTASDPVALRVRVQLWDPSGVPAPPGRQVTVLSWSHQR